MGTSPGMSGHWLQLPGKKTCTPGSRGHRRYQGHGELSQKVLPRRSWVDGAGGWNQEICENQYCNPPFKISKISRYQEKKARNASKTPRQKFEVDRENGGWKERGRGWGKLPKCRKKTLGTSFTCTSLEKITFFSPKNEGLVQDDFSFSKFVDFWGSSRSFSLTKLRRLRNHLCRSKEK